MMHTFFRNNFDKKRMVSAIGVQACSGSRLHQSKPSFHKDMRVKGNAFTLFVMGERVYTVCSWDALFGKGLTEWFERS